MAEARRWTIWVAARHFVPDWRRMAIKMVFSRKKSEPVQIIADGCLNSVQGFPI